MRRICLALYLIEILHQTTTFGRHFPSNDSCILSKFYIKPQPAFVFCLRTARCILSKFYIKPQQPFSSTAFCAGCILSKFYIKPQLKIVHRLQPCRCILSKFYIKPQPVEIFDFFRCVVSYRNSTSNHNDRLDRFFLFWLYLIEILHQTTTTILVKSNHVRLYLIEILHQTTT